MNALAQLGMVSETPSENQTTIATFPSFEGEERKDYFVERDGMKYAGTHLLVDLWGATNLDNPELIDAALRAAATSTSMPTLPCRRSLPPILGVIPALKARPPCTTAGT